MTQGMIAYQHERELRKNEQAYSLEWAQFGQNDIFKKLPWALVNPFSANPELTRFDP